MESVAAKLKRTRLFAGLPDDALAAIVSDPGVRTGDLAEIVDARRGDVVVLLDGGLHMLARGAGGEHLAMLSVNETAPDPAVLYSIPPGAELRLTRFSTYLVVDGVRLDRVFAEAQEARTLATLDDRVRECAAALMRSGSFKALTFEHLVRCAQSMQDWPVSAGEEVVVEGAAGDYFYVLEQGQAEVIRRGVPVARLTAGASFGEEALLQEIARNATVRMVTDGRLLRLAKQDFDRLLKAELVGMIGPDAARTLIERESAALIDCRSEDEWDAWRLPNATLLPLDGLRESVRGLDRSRRYIVYCRTGRRAAAAAFLMRQAGLDAMALDGGIAAWPFEVEGARASR